MDIGSHTTPDPRGESHFTYNGQAQAILSKDFFRRKRVKQDYLWNSLLVFVDWRFWAIFA